MAAWHTTASSASPRSSARRPTARPAPGPSRPAGPRTSATAPCSCPTTSATSWPRCRRWPRWPPPPARCAWGRSSSATTTATPFVLAKEAATLDVLSEGRFELSLGAGWMRSDYDEAGLHLRPPRRPGGSLRGGGQGRPGTAAHRRPVQLPRRALRGARAHPHAPARAAARAPAHHRRRGQAGAVLRGAPRRHRQHQRQPARGDGRRRDGGRRHAGAHPHEGRPG